MVEEAVKPCIQDRLRLVAMRSKEIFTSWPIICLTIIFLIIITLPEILTITIGREVMIPIFSEISLEGRFTILLSFSVLVFSSVQYRLARTRNKINDLRNELEKAYGPLYSIFNPLALDSYGYSDNKGELIQISDINIKKSEKEKLNFILSNYPFMFKPEIFDYWREHLQYQRTENNSGAQRKMFEIRVGFIEMIYDEYHQRIEEYNNLLGKKSARIGIAFNW